MCVVSRSVCLLEATPSDCPGEIARSTTSPRFRRQVESGSAGIASGLADRAVPGTIVVLRGLWCWHAVVLFRASSVGFEQRCAGPDSIGMPGFPPERQAVGLQAAARSGNPGRLTVLSAECRRGGGGPDGRLFLSK